MMLQQKEALAAKPFLKAWYLDTYLRMAIEMPAAAKYVLEIGSGGHDTIKDIIPQCVTSDIIKGNDMQMSATHIIAGDASLDAILALNVYHHLECPDWFLSEVGRCLRPKGRLILVEPAKTWWARLVYAFHYEKENQFRLWEDSIISKAKWSCIYGLDYKRREVFCPFAYLFSGGIKKKWSAPAWMYRMIGRLDNIFRNYGIFAIYVLEKK